MVGVAGGGIWPWSSGWGRGGYCSVRSHLPVSPSETVDQAVECYGLQKITLLREISLKTGIQVGVARWPSVP